MKDNGVSRPDGVASGASGAKCGNVGFFRRKTVIYALCASVAIILLLLLLRFPPEKYHFWPPCLLHELTGIYCPGCGDTRALSALIRGDLAGCFASNVLFLPAILFIIATRVYPKLLRNPYVPLAVLVIIVLFSILRNLPWYPFSLLAPH